LSARATFWAWEQEVSSSEKFVLLCLSDCHNADTGQCNPSVAYVARKTGLNRKTVLKSLKSLNEQGLLTRTKVEGSSNLYHLSLGSTKTGIGVAQFIPEAVPKQGHKPKREPKKNLRYEKGDMDAVETIFNLLLVLNPKHRKPNMEQWANEVRLMRVNDGHTHSEILDLFRFANSDSFWKSNILSPKKLREKWDVLTIKKGDTNQQPVEIWA